MMLRHIIVLCLATVCLGDPKLDGMEEQMDSRIIGGADANITDYSYTLSLEYINNHVCGAAIVRDSWAVTVAGCVTGDQNKYYLRAGSSTRGANGTLHKVTMIIRHSNMTLDPYPDYDIALLQVETPFELGEDVSIIPLPEQDQETPEGSQAVVTGWGLNDTTYWVLPEKLQVATLPVIAQDECDLLYGNFSDQIICTGTGVGDAGGAVSPCYRDDGGPMVVDGELIGVVSSTSFIICGLDGAPAVYTKLSGLRDWIDESILNSAATNGISFLVILSALFYLYVTK